MIEIHGIKSTRLVNFGDDVFAIFLESLSKAGIELNNDDVIVITSKVFSMQQKAAIQIDTIKPSEKANELAIISKIDPRVVQIILDESENKIYGSVYKAILSYTPYGLEANAGVDLSNAPEGYALLLPRNPDNEASLFREKIKENFDKNVAVLITDSKTMPMRRGTFAITLGSSGIDPVIDERGNKDLYGYTMAISTRAIADNIATAANLLMGETSEQIPFAIVRGVVFTKDESGKSILSTIMPEDECLYFGTLINYGKNLK